MGLLLAEGEVTEAYVLQQAQRVVRGGVGGEELHGFVHAHGQHVADALAAPFDRQRLGVEAGAAAGLAQHAHVGQEGHLDLLDTLAFAFLAAPARFGN